MLEFTVLTGRNIWALPVRANQEPRSPALAPAQIQSISAGLACMISTSRQHAIAEGVHPIPPAVYRSLLGYFPAALLQKVRFAADRTAILHLPELDFSYGNALAMTLGEVVLFKSDRLARSDLRLWAHELTHVMQYQRLGIEGFADQYVRDNSAMEQEAIDNADRFMAWLPRRRA